ncbi:MAG TPA: polysaccharide biosynthesis tyrosine autokinase, partial [Thermoanaerobaculia bacterium]|nr:polysaccharide biosynthesis tyrosine autokinase [Thermoanaerobaculia bacterium]
MDLNTQQEVHLSHYWHVIRKRWKVAAAIVLVVMFGTFLASYFSKPLYRAAIQIEIERENSNVTIEDLFGIASSDQEFLQTQYVLLRTRGLALRVIDDHKLLHDPEFYPPGVAGKTPQEIRQIADAMAGGLLGGVQVTPVRNTRLVEIAYVSGSPRLAQKIAEGWGESFMRMNVAKKLESVHHAREFLSQQITAVQSDLEETRRQLQAYGQSKGIISVDESSSGNVTVQKLTQLNTDLTIAQGQHFEKQAAYNAMRNTAPETVAADDPVVQRQTEDLTRLRREYSEKRAQYLEGHPTMKSLTDQIAKLTDARAVSVRQAYAKKLEAARAEMTAAAARESSVRSAYEQQRGEAQKLNVNAARYVDLRMAVEQKQTLLGALQKQLNETEVTARLRGSISSNIHWVDHAQLPGARINLSMKKNLQTAFPLGMILGLAAIFFLEYMDRSIKTPEELERVTQFASLGVIPAAGTVTRAYGYSNGYGRGAPRLRAVEEEDETGGVELIPHTNARSPVSEAYRALRTSLLLASASSPKVIVITSSFAREGKTTTSVNLATVLAQMGKPVLLIDADLRRPRLQKVFPGKMNLGLVNYLAANIPVDDTIQATEVPNLSVMLSGPIPPNPSELLASDRMKHLIEELRAKYAYVIFDSPPILAVTDAVVLAANADGVVLCVHGGHTPRELVQRSAERLRQANIPVLGAILNNLDLHQYGYTYRKSYYDYYDSAEEPQSSTTST